MWIINLIKSIIDDCRVRDESWTDLYSPLWSILSIFLIPLPSGLMAYLFQWSNVAVLQWMNLAAFVVAFAGGWFLYYLATGHDSSPLAQKSNVETVPTTLLQAICLGLMLGILVGALLAS